MRVSILVLTLVVIYGACGIYAEKSTDLIKEELHDGNHLLDFSNIPLEKSMSRNKRSILFSPMTRIAFRLVSLGNNVVIKSALDFARFVYKVLIGQDVCPKIEGLSLDLIEKIIVHPLETSRTIICYIFQVIGNQGRALTLRFLKYFSLFIRKAFLPGLHTVLNRLADTGLLPPSMKAMVDTFNLMYSFLKLIGYIS